jgi:hypothetical protein
VYCKHLRSIKFALRCVAARLLRDMTKTSPSQHTAEAFCGRVLGPLLDLPSTGPAAFASVAGMLAQARAFKETAPCQVQEAMGEPGTVYMRAQRIVVGGLGQTLHRAQLLALAELESAVSLGAGVTPWLLVPVGGARGERATGNRACARGAAAVSPSRRRARGARDR